MDKKIIAYQYDKLDIDEHPKNIVMERDEEGEFSLIVLDNIKNTKIKVLFDNANQILSLAYNLKKFAENPDENGSDPNTWSVRY